MFKFKCVLHIIYMTRTVVDIHTYLLYVCANFVYTLTSEVHSVFVVPIRSLSYNYMLLISIFCCVVVPFNFTGCISDHDNYSLTYVH